MQHEIPTLGALLRRARLARQLRQDDLARLCSIDRSEVSMWEGDRRRPPGAKWRSLARVLGLAEGLLSKLGLAPPARDSRFAERRPDYRPVRDRETWKRLLALWRESRAWFESTWFRLRRQRRWPEVRRFLLLVAADSPAEMRTWIHLLAVLEPGWLAPLKCGFRKASVVCRKTGEFVGDCPVPALAGTWEGHQVKIFPQTPIQVGPDHLVPDALVGMRVGKRTRWCFLELDGRHHNPARDQLRDARLPLPVLRFTTDEIREEGFADRLLRRVHTTMFPAG